MSRTFQVRRLRCIEFESLMVRADLEALKAREEVYLRRHLHACPACREFRNTMIGMRNGLSNAAAQDLHPDPAIRFRLLEKMKGSNSKLQRAFRPLGQWILTLLK
ncbi:MAG: hypothetical protein ACREOO_09855 [bacterium]